MPGQEFNLAGWLGELGLERYAQAFVDAEVTPEILPELTDADLRELGLPLGPRKTVLKAIHGTGRPTGSVRSDKADAARQRAGRTPLPAQRRRSGASSR